MTVHHLVPSEVEPEALIDLIVDCQSLPREVQPHPVVDLAGPRVPAQHRPVDVRIPDGLSSLVEGFDEYV